MAQKKQFRMSERERKKKYVVKTHTNDYNKEENDISQTYNPSTYINTSARAWNIPELNRQNDNCVRRKICNLSATVDVSHGENWNDDNHATYNPLPYVLANDIAHQPPGFRSKAQEKQFKMSERERMKKYVVKTQEDDSSKNIYKSPERNRVIPSTSLDVAYDEIWDHATHTTYNTLSSSLEDDNFRNGSTKEYKEQSNMNEPESAKKIIFPTKSNLSNKELNWEDDNSPTYSLLPNVRRKMHNSSATVEVSHVSTYLMFTNEQS